MASSNFLISVPRKCVGKPMSQSLLLDCTQDGQKWEAPDPKVTPMSLMSSSVILDPLSRVKAEFPFTAWTNDSIIISTTKPAHVYRIYEPYDHFELPLDVSCVSSFGGRLKSTLRPDFASMIMSLSDYTGVDVTVTSTFVLHLYGLKNAVDYARYKLMILLNHFYGYAVCRVELPLSKHAPVSGPDRQSLMTIFQETGVNVYMPPLIGSPTNLSVDEIYLAGNKVQVAVARKILCDSIISKTDSLIKECSVSAFMRDILVVEFKASLEDIMLRNATFIQMTPPGQEDSTTIRIMGTTRRSIENTTESLMKLCGDVYLFEFSQNEDISLLIKLAAASGVSIMVQPDGSSVAYGIRSAMKQLLCVVDTQLVTSDEPSLLLEQPVELMDFILGKKQGKVSKIMSSTGARITVERFSPHTFRLRILHTSARIILRALELVEAELPSEKSLYIPEVYHKQIIGHGGQAIQGLMRKYNVYMRFANTTKEKYPNAFGDSRSDNVVIRCPSKNEVQIDGAADELMELVRNLATKQHKSFVRLTRNHRRLLLATQSNALRDAEVASGAEIRLPPNECRGSQLVEISGQTPACTQQATQIMTDLLPQTDYEFRIPCTARFIEAVGPRSMFCEHVVAPLFMAMSAQVQAFERVQMEGDASIYSQIVVSVEERFEGELFDDISNLITSYLRRYRLDIVDKGRLRANIGTDISTLNNDGTCDRQQQTSQIFVSPLSSYQPKSTPFDDLPRYNHVAPFGSNSKRPEPESIGDSNITVPRIMPEGLPARPPMTALHWNRNFDETPVKKRTFENIDQTNSQSRRRHYNVPRVGLSRPPRRS